MTLINLGRGGVSCEKMSSGFLRSCLCVFCTTLPSRNWQENVWFELDGQVSDSTHPVPAQTVGEALPQTPGMDAHALLLIQNVSE